MNAVLLENVMRSIKNTFARGSFEVRGCSVEGGALPEDASAMIKSGQWYRIHGSIFNDGAHQHPADDLQDETFDGTIELLAVPQAFLALVQEIEDWETAAADARSAAASSPYSSESFGGYSYTMRDGMTGDGEAGLAGWESAFSSQLNQWRKL